MSLQIYNTRTKQKEIFKSFREGKVSMYVCGPTVYDLLHIGNFRGVIFFNCVRHWLEQSGYEVTFALNYTDIDDKIIARAAEKNISPTELTAFYIQAYQDDLKLLNLKPHDINPKCTDHIDDIIALIIKLISDGFAYEVAGSVFFDVHKFKDYGKLSGKRLDDLAAGHRVDPHPDKRHPFDFVLWKPSKDQEPFWESPWGNGRPGWHIECSAMCHAHLGEHVDIHGGGIDLIFPHHENEIAQSECFTGKSFVSFWMHHNFIRFGEEKMSKSLGNVIKARDYMETYHPEVLKYLLLSVHYRSELSVETKQSYQCISALSRVYSALRDADSLANDNAVATDEFIGMIKSTYQLVKTSLNDDFNTPKAFAAIFECVRSFNHEVTSKKPKDVTLQGAARVFVTCIREIGGYFSLFQEEPVLFLKSLDQIMVKQLNLDVAYIEDLLVQRSHARANKDFKKADDIRDELLAKNVLVHDSRDGTTWEINKHFESSQ
ncbi:cysteine--tRNA ligase [bacterium]|nr:cysteine--tRNA ligase [bacterium]